MNRRLARERDDLVFDERYDPQKPEDQVIKAIVSGRNEKGVTQKQLSSLTGITQCDISRLENGTANPSLKTLKRIARALDKQLVIEFR